MESNKVEKINGAGNPNALKDPIDADPQVVVDDQFEYESYYIQEDDNLSAHKRLSDESELQEVINSLSKNKASLHELHEDNKVLKR